MPRGGRRPGAGAPRGNANAFKHGASRAPAHDLVAMIEWLLTEHPGLFGEDPPRPHLDEHGDPWLYTNAQGIPLNPFTGRYVRPRRNTVAAIREARLRLQAEIRREYHRRLIAWYRAHSEAVAASEGPSTPASAQHPLHRRLRRENPANNQ